MLGDRMDEASLSEDAEDEPRNFRETALQICDELHGDDLDGLKFLSRDVIPSAKLERITNSHELLDSWEKLGKFGKDNQDYLAECLYKIRRFDLLEDYLHFDEKAVEDRINTRQSSINSFRNLLFSVAEDLDDEEFQKMVYLLDLKKKEKNKIVSPMSLILYLEQVKLLTENNLQKLKELLLSIDRTDLADMIDSYTGSSSVTSKEEWMDTTESKLNVGSSKVIRESGTRPVKPPHVLGVAAGPGAVHQEPLAPSLQIKVPKQKVLDELVVRSISENLSLELEGAKSSLFGQNLGVTGGTVVQLSNQYPDMKNRIYHMLNTRFHNWEGSSHAALQQIISALHNTQVHHLAEQLSKTYLGQAETQDLSLREVGSGQDHMNISVNVCSCLCELSNKQNIQILAEARYRPEPDPPAPRPAVAEIPEKTLGYYKMTSQPRGLCIIINNEIFHIDENDPAAKLLPNREGTQVDAACLDEAFSNLGFIVQVKNNLTSTEMVRVLLDVSVNADHSDFDIFACCILSHGAHGFIYGCNGCLVNITDLTAPFKSITCPSLAGKPKLFFFQACQGKEKQPGIEIQQDSAEDVQHDGMPTEVIPNEADFLVGYATVPGFVSYRSRTQGSWYINKLCQMLNKYAKKEDMLTILIMVNREVGRANAMLEGGRFKQSPAPLYTLRKKLIFS